MEYRERFRTWSWSWCRYVRLIILTISRPLYYIVPTSLSHLSPGAGLNVHEGPCSISRVLNDHALRPGMIISNEPGYYEVGNFGIRIENLLEVVERKDLGEFAGRNFLGFEKLTQIPIQKKLIDVSLLSDQEIVWINDYHRTVFKNVNSLLKTKRAKVWVEEATSPLRR